MLQRLYQCLFVLWLCCVHIGQAEATPITRFTRLTGNYNYVATGGSLRSEANSGNYCAVGSSSTQSISSIPVGASIVAAYLYWGGSGGTTDATVTFNSSTVNASRTFTSTMSDGTGRVFFGGFANITSLVTASISSVTFSGLTVATNDPYCSTATVMAGWALVVVYERAAEPLRAINIFDGLDTFYGSDANTPLTLIPDGFRIPTSGINGKMTAITWEGDPGNSGTLSGNSESLTFNGFTLDDGAEPANSSPATQQFDGTVTDLGTTLSTTAYGVDVDTYNVTSYLSAGQTSATTVYSAGADRVFLAAQIISVTSEPQVDLSITKTHTGNFTVGSNASYTLQVANAAGVQAVDYLTTVTDTLPSGLTFVSGTGTGWSCSASGQVVSCTHAAPLASGSAFPNLTLNVAVGNAAYPSVSNTASVATAGSNDFIGTNNTATDVATVNGSNLSSSTKTVSDLNSGEANPGDTLRYTLTLVNSTAVTATGVSVTDALPGNTTNLQVVSYPSGASNTSTTTQLSVSNITVPANGSVSIVFDVTIVAGTSPGATIDNTANITNPGGVSATPSAPTVTVSPSQVAGSGTKQLYLWSSPGNVLSRTRPTGTHNAVTVAAQGGSVSWTLTPTLQTNLSLQAGNYLVPLLLSESGSGSSRSITVSLTNSVLGNLGSTSQTVNLNGTPAVVNFTLTMPAVTVPAGSVFTLTITNNTNINPNAGTRVVNVTPYNGAIYSRVELNSLTVINVDNVNFYSAAFSGGTVTSSVVRGNTVYVRALVSDPFGSFDITGATLTLSNPSGTVMVNAAAMTQVADSGAASKTYEYSYAVPGNAVAGIWTASVIAREGAENTITDLGVNTFTVTVPMPTLSITKLSSVVWDPINGSTNPKRIPGSIVSYTITVTNSGSGSVDASSLLITDPLPSNTSLCVLAVAQCTLPQFTDGPVASGLSLGSAGVSYSNAVGGGSPFSYTPSGDANGVDGNITGIRIAPSGAMNGATSGNPSFSVHFRVRVR